MSAPATVTEAHYALRRDVIFSAPDEGAQLIADSEAKACAELRGALALGQQNCDDVFEDLRAERDQLHAEVEEQCLLNGKGAEREADLLGRLERAEREVERLKADGAASAFVSMACRASHAEADRNNLRADLDAIKAILTEEKARAERAEASLHALRLVCGTTDADKFSTWVDRANARAEKAEAQSAAVTKTNIENADAYRLMQGRVISAEVELATERARLDWLMAGGVCMIQHTGGFHVSRLHAPVSRAAIDAAMKEETK